MERTRQAPPASSDESEAVSLPSVEGEEAAVSRAERPRVSVPEDLPPLATLVEEVRAPGAGRAEVDALLAGLSQPLPPEHSPRERADLLLSVIGDEVIATYTGSDGGTVRGAAIQALIALGYPYALEVPPEALEAFSREKGALDSLSAGTSGSGFGLVILAAVAQAAYVGYALLAEGLPTFTAGAALAIIFATTLLPALLAMGGQRTGSSGLKKVGTVWLKIVSCLWAAVGLLSLGSLAFALIPLILAALIYCGARFMDSPDER
ncbi:hypothetical protein [Hyalangium minutum]|uniref:Uncharacterized protein n=1 Tax=Hyalangium minutum TaxID=394096 RepID=A0A085WK89_9BACT|nr:hypothetical protein [Hyalangium minutum]KFE68102.1 hypothetical protein DB31_7339 [Hyalangium minutum]